ncbi:endonuclease/exonuclease/phosphatase family protein [bacterium]|nr:endonuclease/exonuclease/phosphatase family protein [bacterium]
MQEEKACNSPVSIFIANLLVSNSEHDRFVREVSQVSPDILALCEPNDRWHGVLQEHFGELYPHKIHEFREDGHGIALWSKLPFRRAEVHFLVSKERPSLSATVLTPEGIEFECWVIHPAPPAVKLKDGSRKDSRPRDAELLTLGRRLQEISLPVVVAGDFNDTGWSRTTRMFKKLSGLRDPRVGRGFYTTYPVDYPLLRYPIDHVFVSQDIGLKDISRRGKIGSDHFPFLVSFQFFPHRSNPSGEKVEEVDVEGIVERGKELGRKYEGREDG